MEKKKFDFESFAKNAADDLRSGKPMVGRDGVFTPLLKMLIEGAESARLSVSITKFDTKWKKRNLILRVLPRRLPTSCVRANPW